MLLLLLEYLDKKDRFIQAQNVHDDSDLGWGSWLDGVFLVGKCTALIAKDDIIVFNFFSYNLIEF